MAKYLLIESRDPYEYADTHYFYDLAGDLARRGNEVVFFLIQNGVLVTREGAQPNKVAALQAAAPRIRVVADEFSLRERGIRREAVIADVEITDVGRLVDLLMDDGRKPIWH
jgi:sulfur relay (sulfurtransferase) complex TusBCD TusD component (DsrE family)